MTILEVVRESIPVNTYSPSPDKNWTYTDHQGHEHYYENGYPTLDYESEDYYCVDCEDSHNDGTLVCAECREQINPGMVAPPNYTQQVPGMVRYLVDGEEVSQEEFQSYLEYG